MKYMGPPLFKYLPRCHAESAINKGEFRITTFDECRSREKIGDQRVDDGEGGANVALFIEEYKAGEVEVVPLGLAQIFKIPPGAKGIHFLNCPIVQRTTVPDAFLFCMSTCYSPFLLDHFECDSCLIIRDPAGFRYHLGRALDAKVGIKRAIDMRPVDYDARALEVRYRDGKHHWKDNRHPAFLKPKDYEFEQEIRAIWQSSTLPIEPVIVTSPEAASCCEIIEPGKKRQPRYAIEMW